MLMLGFHRYLPVAGCWACLFDVRIQTGVNIQTLESHLTGFMVSQLSPELSPKLDLSIEGMQSQQFSVGVFVFLLIGIVVFSAIVITLMFNLSRKENLKSGERWMLTAVVIGVVVSVIIGALQMLGGYLF
jgi:uncharacterized membrane protein YidH (DUF202 family)